MRRDQLYKELLQEFFPEFLELFYPDVAARLDLRQEQHSVVFLDKESFTDLSSGRRREADLVAQVYRRNGGQSEIVLIHIELQTQRRSNFSQRMFEYYAVFRLRHQLPVYPIVVYLSPGAGGIVEEEYVEELFGDTFLRFRYKAVGLPDLAAADYLANPNPLAPALSSLMRADAPARRALRKATILSQRAIIDTNEARRVLLLSVVEQNLPLDAEQQAEFDRLMADPEYQEVQQLITPYEQRGIEIGRQQGISEGISQGISQGINQGISKGLHRAVFSLLEARFAAISPALRARVEAIDDPAELEKLLIRIAGTDSLEAVELNVQ